MEEPLRRKPPPLPENFLSLQQLQEMRLREQEQKRTEERQRKLIEEEAEKNKLEKQREEEEQEKVRKSVEALRIADGGRRSGFRGRRVGERMVFREVKERDDSTEADQKEAEAEMAIQMTKKKLNKRKAARRRAVAAAAETGIVEPPDMKLDEAKIGVREEKEAVLVAEIAGEPAEATVVVKAKIVPRARKLQGRRARYAADLSAKSAAEELETVDGGEKGAESPCEKLDSAPEVSGEAAEVGISTNDAVSLETKVVPNRRWKFRGLAARSAGSKPGAVTVNGAEKGDESAVAIEAGVSGKPVAALGAEVGMRSQQDRGPRYVARKSAAAEAALKRGGRRRWGRGSVGGKWVPKGAQGTEGNGI